jgi:arylsulfatase A-like enzyme
VLAVAVVLGWLAHDALLLALSGEPKLALEGLPRTLLVVVGAALAGVLLALVRELLVLLLAGAGAAVLVLPRLRHQFDLTEPELVLVRAVLALSLALLAAALAARLAAGSALRHGFAAGGLACVTFWWLFRDMDLVSIAFGAACAAWLLLGFVRQPTLRLCATLAAGGAFAAYAGYVGWRDAPPVLRDPAGVEQSGGLSTGGERRPDVVLIVLDTVRADHLAPYGHSRVTTPRLDAFARRHAVRYVNARSTSSWTLPSHASLFTGLMPAQHGATHPREGDVPERRVESAALPAQALRPDVPTLATILRAHGYRTGAVLANSAYLDARFGLARGFEHYDARPGGFVKDYLPLVQLAGGPLRAGHLLYRDAQTITDLALAWIDDADGRPFFLAVNYMDAHSPYLPPPPFDELFGPPARDPLELAYHERREQYDRSLAYLDSELSRLLERLDLEHALVVITSDHGESLGDHGYWTHNWVLYEPVVKVPLYVKPLAPRAAEQVEDPITGAEVFHLILGALGLSLPAAPRPPGLVAEWYRVPHKPTADVLADKDVDRDLLAWVEGQRKLIVASSGAVELYDLSTDPHERRPLSLTEEERAAALERAETWWRENPPPAAGAVVPFDADEIERMRGLGYLGGR